MAATEGPVVVCSYPARDQADDFVAEFRKRGVPTVVAPSDYRAGDWDVLEPASDADRVYSIVDALLAHRRLTRRSPPRRHESAPGTPSGRALVPCRAPSEQQDARAAPPAR
jgi:hypothetical protein